VFANREPALVPRSRLGENRKAASTPRSRFIDAESKCPKELAPRLVAWAKEARADADIACVLPNPMFETWFASSAASLAGVNGLPRGLPVPDDPEGNRLGKSLIKTHLRRKYSDSSESGMVSPELPEDRVPGEFNPAGRPRVGRGDRHTLLTFNDRAEQSKIGGAGLG